MGVQVFNITKKIVARVQGDLADQGAKDLRVLIREAYQERFKGKLTEAWQKLQDGKIDKFTKDGREVVFELADASQKHSGWAWPKKVWFQLMTFIKLQVGAFFKKSLNLKKTGVAMKTLAKETENAKKLELEDLRKTVTRERDDIAYNRYLDYEKIIEGHVNTIVEQEKLIENARKIEKTLATKATETDNLLAIEREKLADLQKKLEEKTSTLMDPKDIEKQMKPLQERIAYLQGVESENRKLQATILEMSQKVQQADKIQQKVTDLQTQLKVANQKLKNEQLANAHPESETVKRALIQKDILIEQLQEQLRRQKELMQEVEAQQSLITSAKLILGSGRNKEYAVQILTDSFNPNTVREYTAMMTQHSQLRGLRTQVEQAASNPSSIPDLKSQIETLLDTMKQQPQLKEVVDDSTVKDIKDRLAHWSEDPTTVGSQSVLKDLFELSKEIYKYRKTLPEQPCIHWIQVAHYDDGIV